MATTPEGKVKAIIRERLDGISNCYYFMPPSNGFGRAGVPDFVGHVDGKFFAIEAKAEGGKATALQLREIAKIIAAGGQAFVVSGETEARNFEGLV